MAPVDGGSKGLLPGQRRSAAPGEQSESVLQARDDVFGAHHLHPRRGQLDREGDAVKAVADLDDGRSVGRRQRELRLSGLSSIDEQPNCLVLIQHGDIQDLFGSGIERVGTRHAVSPAMFSGSRLVARRRRAGATRRSDSAKRATASREMLAIVQDEQQTSVGEAINESLAKVPSSLFPDVDGLCDGAFDLCLI